jgi:hypothetical protein
MSGYRHRLLLVLAACLTLLPGCGESSQPDGGAPGARTPPTYPKARSRAAC